MEKEIWALEKAWYTHHCNGEPDKAYALLHNQFLGWPSIESSVVDKAGLITFIDKEDEELECCEFTFEDPTSAKVMGDTAINHYKVRLVGRYLDGREFNEALHVSHTWIKENLQWKLLSGIAYEVA